jgi:hypothetical protein
MKKRLNKNSAYSQGIFSPIHSEKYKGSLPIIFRSSLELKAYKWLDTNSNVISWGSESVVVPYISPIDNRMHRYFVDVVAQIKRKDGLTQKYLIEIKPSKFLLEPKNSPRKSNKTLIYEVTQYSINTAKWDAAQRWCVKNNYTFLIFTEKHIEKFMHAL